MNKILPLKSYEVDSNIALTIPKNENTEKSYLLNIPLNQQINSTSELPNVTTAQSWFPKKLISNTSKRREAKSMMLKGNETIEDYFKRIDMERNQKKTLLQEEIKEQMQSLTTIFPSIKLSKNLKTKWFRVRNKLKLHCSFMKSHRNIKLFGITHTAAINQRHYLFLII